MRQYVAHSKAALGPRRIADVARLSLSYFRTPRATLAWRQLEASIRQLNRNARRLRPKVFALFISGPLTYMLHHFISRAQPLLCMYISLVLEDGQCRDVPFHLMSQSCSLNGIPQQLVLLSKCRKHQETAYDGVGWKLVGFDMTSVLLKHICKLSWLIPLSLHWLSTWQVLSGFMSNTTETRHHWHMPCLHSHPYSRRKG